MIKKNLCAVALLAATINVYADDFTYISGGLLYNKHGISSSINERFDGQIKAAPVLVNYMEALKLKSNGVGIYLNGSVGFDNNVFVEGRLQNSQQISNYLLGVGYHYPVMQQVDLYGLVGVSKRHVQISNPNRALEERDANGNLVFEKMKEISGTYSGSFRPTAEIGVKARLTDDIGVNVAYRFAQFTLNSDGSQEFKEYNLKKGLHEGRVGGYFKVADNLAVEAGYTYTSYLKGYLGKNKMLKDHVGQIGLRYAF